MKTKVAFMGFRHGHINSLYRRVMNRDDAEIVAGCEEDSAAREDLRAGTDVQITHENYEHMLDTVECDAIAVGDYYGKRGRIIIEALKRGKHVISDKPLCTQLDELDEIERLAAAKTLVVSLMLGMRDVGVFRRMRQLVQTGEIGEPHVISFGGQHPLMYGSRPGWYFEKGKHGGTINDIAIHAIDLVPWITGVPFTVINAARNWNAGFNEVPFFKNAAQMMLTMENGCGVLGDVSYFAPDSLGYSLPQYWRLTVWGSQGLAETSVSMKDVMLYKNGEKEPRAAPGTSCMPDEGYLESFLQEIRGRTKDQHLSSADCFRASRVTLLIQQAADHAMCNVRISAARSSA